jgi:hypothetical protein
VTAANPAVNLIFIMTLYAKLYYSDRHADALGLLFAMLVSRADKSTFPQPAKA